MQETIGSQEEQIQAKEEEIKLLKSQLSDRQIQLENLEQEISSSLVITPAMQLEPTEQLKPGNKAEPSDSRQISKLNKEIEEYQQKQDQLTDELMEHFQVNKSIS